MKVSITLCALICCCSFVSITEAYKSCIDFDPAYVDLAFFGKVKKWYVITHSGCENCDRDEDWSWVRGRKSPTFVCYEAELLLRGKPSKARFNCEFTEVNSQHCKFLVDGKDWGLKGPLKIIATDNTAWTAGSICIYGKEQFWYLIATTPTLPETEKAKALAEVQKKGFVLNDMDITKFKFETFDVVNC